ncbi:MAG: choice-of-anchor V domain-containing protein [Bacteroidia bacterium]
MYYASEPSLGATGAPDKTTCRACEGLHAAGSAEITKEGEPVVIYLPDKKYTICLKIIAQAPTFSMGYGFSMTTLNDKGRGAGTLSGEKVSPSQSASRQYVGHLGPSSTGEWTFTWQVPYVGAATFYVACNILNKNNSLDYALNQTVRILPC